MPVPTHLTTHTTIDMPLTIIGLKLHFSSPPHSFHLNNFVIDVAYCDEMEPHHLKPADLKLMYEGINSGINVKHGECRSVAHDVPVCVLNCTILVVSSFIPKGI